MKVLLFGHRDQIQEYADYIGALKKIKPVQSLFLTMGLEEYGRALEVGVFDEVDDILPNESEIDVADTDMSNSAQLLTELENRIGYQFVNRDILMDRHFRGQTKLDQDLNTAPLIWTGSRTKQFMYLLYKRLEDKILSFDPDFMFVETQYAPGRMAWRLAREKGVSAGYFMPVGFWPGRFYLETGIGYDWEKVRIAYREMPGTPMTGAELEKVKQRLTTIRNERVKPAYLKSEHAKGAPKLLRRLRPIALFTGLYDWLGKRARTSTRNPMARSSKIFSPTAKYLRYMNGQKAIRYLLKHQTPFSEIDGKKYAIYFLHVQPELTVEGMAFDYQDQVNTLRNILAALPADMYLVVKEHTPMLGYRPLSVYSQIVHMPGIIIANTHEDSHKLITEASVVVTLTGTVALEAVLYGIPAIVLGSVYFDEFNGISKPENLSEMKQLLSNPDNLQRATECDALRVLGSMLRASEIGRPPRVDVRLQEVDFESAKVMMSELEKLGEVCMK